ncbi:hypothetical protein PoB_006905800 [Plakobranchus ocellatus]|uniref:Uncharacterized protein n=1 Tax=Plakobranchus ocellatus TaxID=259542 RepID=A0AAV4DEA5_9GAST|nr:hypothetical protein PoB_006905800 [Plakobranchus ocellatus]
MFNAKVWGFPLKPSADHAWLCSNNVWSIGLSDWRGSKPEKLQRGNKHQALSGVAARRSQKQADPSGWATFSSTSTLLTSASLCPRHSRDIVSLFSGRRNGEDGAGIEAEDKRKNPRKFFLDMRGDIAPCPLAVTEWKFLRKEGKSGEQKKQRL